MQTRGGILLKTKNGLRRFKVRLDLNDRIQTDRFGDGIELKFRF